MKKAAYTWGRNTSAVVLAWVEASAVLRRLAAFSVGVNPSSAFDFLVVKLFYSGSESCLYVWIVTEEHESLRDLYQNPMVN